MKIWRNLLRKKLLVLLFVVLVSLLAVGGILFLRGGKDAPTETEKDPTVITHSTDKPSEDPIDKTVYRSTASAKEPKYISMPTAGIEAFIQKVGIDQNNEVAVPDNIYLAGWYVNSLAPGQEGLSVIDGHVDGQVNGGVFRNLSKLKTGDRFTVQLGDDSNLDYQVLSINSVSLDDADKVLFSHSPNIKSQLNLITCGGSFDRSTFKYDHRIIAVSELVD